MIQNKSVLVVVPARGGSKGVPLKNLQPIEGLSLVARVGHLVSNLDWVDRAIVSTDHEGIATEAKASGLEAPFYRPDSLSGDSIGDLDVLVHALKKMEEIDRKVYDITVMLQPTSPLRKKEHVQATVEKLVAGQFDAVWTISPLDLKTHPFKQLHFNEGKLSLFDERGNHIVARQQLTPLYFRNGAAYAFSRDCLLNQKTILGKNSSAVVIEEPLVSIDTPDDFKKVESHLRDYKENTP